MDFIFIMCFHIIKPIVNKIKIIYRSKNTDPPEYCVSNKVNSIRCKISSSRSHRNLLLIFLKKIKEAIYNFIVSFRQSPGRVPETLTGVLKSYGIMTIDKPYKKID